MSTCANGRTTARGSHASAASCRLFAVSGVPIQVLRVVGQVAAMMTRFLPASTEATVRTRHETCGDEERKRPASAPRREDRRTIRDPHSGQAVVN